MTYLGICVPGAEEIAGNPLKPVISHFPNPNQCDNRALPCCLVDVNTLMASSWRGSMSLLPRPHLGHPQPLRSVHSVRSRQSCHPPSRTQPILMKPFIFHHALPCPPQILLPHNSHTNFFSTNHATTKWNGPWSRRAMNMASIMADSGAPTLLRTPCSGPANRQYSLVDLQCVLCCIDFINIL